MSARIRRDPLPVAAELGSLTGGSCSRAKVSLTEFVDEAAASEALYTSQWGAIGPIETGCVAPGPKFLGTLVATGVDHEKPRI
jgi:hypothetical protein